MDVDAFGIQHLWAQADTVIRVVAAALLAMSVASWYVIALRGHRVLRASRQRVVLQGLWALRRPEEVAEALERRAAGSVFAELAGRTVAAVEQWKTHGAGTPDAEDCVARAFRRVAGEAAARREQGLTLLASVGSTAPFIGLFGTVWGIYHALVAISASGAATLDKVAGPVGEALIMTAFGLFVAIPAVLAYNAFGRANRIEQARLESFAHDLHAWLEEAERRGGPARLSQRAAS
ncbi:MotA/TolQ/ExbB proton channel family protein [Pseudothauera nasutitermitis]|uniref:Biopolymer transport protein ExbB n=1 Tax=Pseudothauera nasutitermitis TaxID=2565930 RepID=A0A4S4B3L0_9RHOO|nr:MotA/TolQ/ExbB proton channel family protein [Pseudothauera nasutitermitis]THF67260.1 MotA/TolQ/ExbB proton channel family protein [Pseudothauera nasutitermitis]